MIIFLWPVNLAVVFPQPLFGADLYLLMLTTLTAVIRDPAFIWLSAFIWGNTVRMCVCVCYLRCGRSTRATHGCDRSAMDFSSSSGNLIRDSTSSGTAGCSDAWPGALLVKTLLEKKKHVNLLENNTFKFKHTRHPIMDENKIFD